MKLRHVELSGDVEGSYVVEAACNDGRLLLAPATSASAIMGHLHHELLTSAEFDAICAAVRSPDGEG